MDELRKKYENFIENYPSDDSIKDEKDITSDSYFDKLNEEIHTKIIDMVNKANIDTLRSILAVSENIRNKHNDYVKKYIINFFQHITIFDPILGISIGRFTYPTSLHASRKLYSMISLEFFVK